MKLSSLVLLAYTGLSSGLTQQCTGNAVNEGGNWFCGAVKEILYQGFSSGGSYKTVTNMGNDGSCQTQPFSYSGTLGPLSEDLSIHIRGPFKLREFAVYNLDSSQKKRDAAPSPHIYTHPHGHTHLHEQRKQKRGQWVTATINGQVVSWENTWFGSPATQAAPAPALAAPTKKPVSKPKPNTGSEIRPSQESAAPVFGGHWKRTSYYNAQRRVTNNVMFMGNYGGQGSGVFDYTWGNSLSYLNANGNGGSSSPKVLKYIYIPSNKEFSIFSAQRCDKSCGYSRAPNIAYEGFSGSNKIFLFNFKMPLDGKRGFNGDMPALWALNARIPRTMQYGACSCWTTGCGEVDIYEVLASGDTKCKSTFHLNNGAGSSDYFKRPTDNYIKVAVVFDGRTSSVAIKQLPDSFDFGSGLSDETVRSWIKGMATPKKGSSLFQLSS
ncbi:target of Sbf [Fusarium torreyae]|uniref:glucan endo-1,3-beta-D-glucosidase n=1 Tax=Fusarium torreyae TaxID=1237075 RepID=A0A9W8VMX4_9HYPO|nr:target of Sbf [Fusarium torreyae]